ncbi:MAG: FdtA/QdtA family cupin domain-containing protein [Candidatus Promineifilaceae bacterium]|nr:FdtA/QdtA family cupin domain-containing protein [Candidatus Promineifilaceae bacterium]
MSNLKNEILTAGRLDAVRWISLPSHQDGRGVLTAIESGIDLPFEIKRVYLLHHISQDRGGHAHCDTQQIVIALSGCCEMVLSNGQESRCYRLDDATRGLYLGPMLFISMRNFSPDAGIVVLASTHYDKTRSIRSWEQYLEVIGR